MSAAPPPDLTPLADLNALAGLTALAHPALLPALMAVAFLYATVGHAGASGYIAVLALAGLPPLLIKPLALLLNTAVATVGCWQFTRAGHLPWRRIWPVVPLAVPAAFLGGWWNLPAAGLARLVGVVLLISAWRLGRVHGDPPQLRPVAALPLALGGGAIGLLAGLTGTGGGVFLSPLLLLRRWCTTREAAATASGFILLNSLAGLAGLALAQPTTIAAVAGPPLPPLMGAVLLAGGLGARLGSRHWPVAWIRRCLAVVLVVAALKLLDPLALLPGR